MYSAALPVCQRSPQEHSGFFVQANISAQRPCLTGNALVDPHSPLQLLLHDPASLPDGDAKEEWKAKLLPLHQHPGPPDRNKHNAVYRAGTLYIISIHTWIEVAPRRTPGDFPFRERENLPALGHGNHRDTVTVVSATENNINYPAENGWETGVCGTCNEEISA